MGVKSSDEMAEAVGESKNQIFRFIRLTELIPDLLNMVDEGRIAFRPAVELSYLTKEQQAALLETIFLHGRNAVAGAGHQDEGVFQERQARPGCIESIMTRKSRIKRRSLPLRRSACGSISRPTFPMRKPRIMFSKRWNIIIGIRKGRKREVRKDKRPNKGQVCPFSGLSVLFPLSHSPPQKPAVPAEKKE